MNTSNFAKARAETLGSLIQPKDLLEVRATVKDGSGNAQQLHTIEDRAVLASIGLQESVGLDVITDGEMRRSLFADTIASLENVVQRQAPRSYPLSTVPTSHQGADNNRNRSAGASLPLVSGRLKTKEHVSLGSEYLFLQEHTKTRTKYTMASPSFHRRYWSDSLQAESGYENVEEWLFDVRDWFRGRVSWLIEQGCTYVQFDAPNYGSLCDPETVAWHYEQGHDVKRDLEFDAKLDSSVCEGLPVTSALHICRGNLPGGTWFSSGGYAAIAEQVFPNLDVDVALLEYDSERAGDFEPITLLKQGLVAVLGLITTKDGQLESDAEIEARINEAAKLRSLDDLALSTQCGFASSANAPMTEDEQRTKLETVATVAHRVWS